MKEDNKLLDAVIDLGMAVKELRSEVKELRSEMKGMRQDMNAQLEGLNHRVENLEKEQHKTNILLAEHSRSIIELAQQQEKTNTEIHGLRSDFNKYAKSSNVIINGHETRIIRLEDASFNNDDKKMTMLKEPKAIYKKKIVKNKNKH
ncbi:MAG: hypothetical protein HY840_15125 [Bacteroidetes bacterium]|nr:hypothetical protein [Bacteroidota bacterium]